MNKSGAMILGLYAHRLFALASAVRQSCDRIFELAPLPEKDDYIQVSPELHALIDAVAIDAANIKKLIDTPADRQNGESERAFVFRRTRTKQLQQLLKGLSLAAICGAKLRNSLEHFDEYLDKLGARLDAGQAPPDPAAAYNLACSRLEALTTLAKRDVYPVRLYVAATKTYCNFNRSIDLGAVREEAAAIEHRILESGAIQPATDPGGMLVLFPSEESDQATEAGA